jgi:hypothetical protein
MIGGLHWAAALPFGTRRTSRHLKGNRDNRRLDKSPSEGVAAIRRPKPGPDQAVCSLLRDAPETSMAIPALLPGHVGQPQTTRQTDGPHHPVRDQPPTRHRQRSTLPRGTGVTRTAVGDSVALLLELFADCVWMVSSLMRTVTIPSNHDCCSAGVESRPARFPTARCHARSDPAGVPGTFTAVREDGEVAAMIRCERGRQPTPRSHGLVDGEELGYDQRQDHDEKPLEVATPRTQGHVGPAIGADHRGGGERDRVRIVDLVAEDEIQGRGPQ